MCICFTLLYIENNINIVIICMYVRSYCMYVYAIIYVIKYSIYTALDCVYDEIKNNR